MDRNEALNQLGFLKEGSAFNEIDNMMAAFGHGFKRDFTFESYDELRGMLEKIQGGDYKEKRDEVRKFLNYVRKEYPNMEQAGRIVSAFGQPFLFGGSALAPRALALLISRYGLKTILKFSGPIGRKIQQSPRIRMFFENLGEAGANLVGEAEEMSDIDPTSPGAAMAIGLSALSPTASKGWEKFKKTGIPAGVGGFFSGLDKRTRDWVRNNYEAFFPRRKNVTSEEVIGKFTNFLDDLQDNMEKVRMQAQGMLEEVAPKHKLIAKKGEPGVVKSFNDVILSLFEKKGIGEIRSKIGLGLPRGDEFINPQIYKDLKNALENNSSKEVIDGILKSSGNIKDRYFKEAYDVLMEKRDDILKLARDKIDQKLPVAITDVKLRGILDDLTPHTDFKSPRMKDLSNKQKKSYTKAFNSLYGKLNKTLKDKNEPYKKRIEIYERVLRSMKGDPSKNIEGIEEVLGIVKKGNAYDFDDRGKALNRLLELEFNKKDLSKKTMREFLTAAHILHTTTKAAKKYSNLKNEMRNLLAERVFHSKEHTPAQLSDFVRRVDEQAKDIPILVPKPGADTGDWLGLSSIVGLITSFGATQAGYEIPAPIALLLAAGSVHGFMKKKVKGAGSKGVDWIVEAEKLAKGYIEDPEVYFKKVTGLKLPEFDGFEKWSMELAPEIGRSLEDYSQRDTELSPTEIKRDSSDEWDKAPSTDEEEKEIKPGNDQWDAPPSTSEIKQKQGEKTFADLPEVFGAPPKEEMRSPAHTGKLEPIEETEELEVVPNPEEKDRADREEKVQSFLDQQLGGKVGKRKYA